MFDYIKRSIPPGESDQDSHHLGAQVSNPSEVDVKVKLQLEEVALYLTLPPNGFVTASEEQSAHSLVVQNMSEQSILVEWKKTRD